MYKPAKLHDPRSLPLPCELVVEGKRESHPCPSSYRQQLLPFHAISRARVSAPGSGSGNRPRRSFFRREYWPVPSGQAMRAVQSQPSYIVERRDGVRRGARMKGYPQDANDSDQSY
jgi:hypothetical protein